MALRNDLFRLPGGFAQADQGLPVKGWFQRSPTDAALNWVECDPSSESVAAPRLIGPITAITIGEAPCLRLRAVNIFREAKRRSPPRLRRSANSF
jgi:hypothetical protein